MKTIPAQRRRWEERGKVGSMALPPQGLERWCDSSSAPGCDHGPSAHVCCRAYAIRPYSEHADLCRGQLESLWLGRALGGRRLQEDMRVPGCASVFRLRAGIAQ